MQAQIACPRHPQLKSVLIHQIYALSTIISPPFISDLKQVLTTCYVCKTITKKPQGNFLRPLISCAVLSLSHACKFMCHHHQLVVRESISIFQFFDYKYEEIIYKSKQIEIL